MKILFVDDEPATLEQAKTFLEKEEEKLDVETAVSAEEGLELLDRENYDAIVSGYQMPEVDGLEFLETVRKDRGNDIPFIMFTRKGCEEVAIEALSLGANRYLNKGGDSKSQHGVLADAIVQEVDHYRTEIEKERARKEWRRTFDALPDIAALISPDHEIIRVNQRGVDALGMDREDIVGKKCYEVVHDQDAPIEECPCEKVIETGEPDMGKVFEENGRYYIAAASPMLDENGEVEAFAHTVKDITERRRAEKKFQETSEKLQTIFESMEDAVIMTDLEGNIIETNEAAVRMAGFEDKEEYMKHNAFEFVHPEDREIAKKTTEKTFEDGTVQDRKEYRIQSKNGKVTHTRTSTSLIRDDSGEPIATVNIVRDITERKEAEEELRRSEERKDFLNTLLRQDLKNKYQIIYGYYQLLEEEADLPEEQRKYLKKSLKAASEADKILGLAKKLDKIEGTKQITEKDIIKVLKFVIDNVSGLVGKKGIEIEENYPETISEVKGDYSLNTLFTQLLAMRIKLGECSRIRIGGRERGEDILLSIEDDGKQLPGDVKDLFTGKVYKGDTSGVGGVRYYMLKEIARHNNAKIEVQGSDLGGARFDIYLQKA